MPNRSRLETGVPWIEPWHRSVPALHQAIREAGAS